MSKKSSKKSENKKVMPPPTPEKTPVKKLDMAVSSSGKRADQQKVQKKSTPKKSTPKKSTPKKSTPKKSTPKKSSPGKQNSNKQTPTKSGQEDMVKINLAELTENVSPPKLAKAYVRGLNDVLKELTYLSSDEDKGPKKTRSIGTQTNPPSHFQDIVLSILFIISVAAGYISARYKFDYIS